MIKQIKSSEIKNFISENKDVELLDVRTQEEWDSVGKPDGEKLGLKTHFVTIVRSPDPSANKGFVEDVKKKIDPNKQLLIICKAGGRSMMAAQLLSQEQINCINISDGFEGNSESLGWKSENLPFK
ncbi:rhodanese-like domain-containing protein [Pelagibacteraceae bacterium]|nr:rhodanese-like domain-containing protein [Pelagibacteraceae bacterium]